MVACRPLLPAGLLPRMCEDLVFGVATVAGIWTVGVLVDRHLRSALLTAPTLIAAARLFLGLFGQAPAALLIGAAVWGAAFGGAPTLPQTALVDFSGPAHADVATSLQATVYNIGIAAGSLIGGIVLEGAGAGDLPWTALPLIATALATTCAARGIGHRERRIKGGPESARSQPSPLLHLCALDLASEHDGPPR
ncbi:MFS transporter [Streptomyces sp. NBC_00322]|uniref:MFS transporter n=1 Tax=Streptomyces sp. NBC_00322 TaxID=2975712 RepID=UPI002E2A0552|nr:MFS transporter [Streptomyces sp. NBC_00322]